MTTLEIGKRLVEMCDQGKFREAVVELYADDAVSEEAMAMPGHPAKREGKEAILKASDEWEQMTEVHSNLTEGPWPHGDRFIVTMEMDCTSKAGPMAGQRMKHKEAILYECKAGKITHVSFFYSMEGCE